MNSDKNNAHELAVMGTVVCWLTMIRQLVGDIAWVRLLNCKLMKFMNRVSGYWFHMCLNSGSEYLEMGE